MSAGFMEAITGALTSNTEAAINDLGRFYSIWDATYGTRIFKYVKNNDNALTAQAPTAIDYAAAAAASSWQVKIPATATIAWFAGIAMAALSTGYHGWVQVLGYTSGVLVRATATNGPSSTAGWCAKPVAAAAYMTEDTTVTAGPTTNVGPRYVRMLETYIVTDATAARKALIFAGLW
jgi:hypothetical protein